MKLEKIWKERLGMWFVMGKKIPFEKIGGQRRWIMALEIFWGFY